ncbi:hypothetical protein [Actinophytocola sp.]|uniref:hypothetical protein n=1 Tax=Actinophytocola sp. TaxID=1872138 RepID=UPI002ED044FC
MKDLDLPPHSPLPPEVRDRIRTRVNAVPPRSRYRAPLSVAAAVAVVAAGAVIVGQPMSGTSDGYRAGTTALPSATTVPGSSPQLTVSRPNAQSDEDLDRCWAAVATSPRVAEYAPRSTWQPVFTVTRARPGRGIGLDSGSLVRVTAFSDNSGKPGFCENGEVLSEGSKRSWGATVSDPSAEPIPLAAGGGANIYGTYFSHGLLAGVAQGVDSLTFRATNPHPDTGEPIGYDCPPVVRDGLFLVEVGGLHVPSGVAVKGFDDGNEVISGEWTYDPAKDPMTGPSMME